MCLSPIIETYDDQSNQLHMWWEKIKKQNYLGEPTATREKKKEITIKATQKFKGVKHVYVC